MGSLLNGARMCILCGTMSPSPSEDKPYAAWILHHVIRMLCVEPGPTIAPDDI